MLLLEKQDFAYCWRSGMLYPARVLYISVYFDNRNVHNTDEAAFQRHRYAEIP